MAHLEQQFFIQYLSQHLAHNWNGLSILEIGSLSREGGVRQFFQGSRFIGTDLVEGEGVDIAACGSKLDFPDNTFDVTISCECFEHNPVWPETFANMIRMTRPGGCVIMTCATRGRIEHGTMRTDVLDSIGTTKIGWNYYKNLVVGDFTQRCDFEQIFQAHIFLSNSRSRDLFFVGLKAGVSPGTTQFNLNSKDLIDSFKSFRRRRWITSPLQEVLHSVYYFPVRILECLVKDEVRFQSAAILYKKFISRNFQFLRRVYDRYK